MHYDADTLDDYLHGALGPERDAVIHAHLEACAPCRALYDEAATVRDWLRTAAQAEEREFPSMIKARVWERVRAMPATPSFAERLRALWRPMIAVPVAAVLAAFIYVGVPHAGAPPTGVAATYLLEEHAAVASDNPLADRGLIVPASITNGSQTPNLIEADDSRGHVATVALRGFAAAVAFAAACSWPAIGTAATKPAPPDSNALVRQALEAPRHVSYVGQLQTIRWGTRVANATIQRVEHLAPSSTRRTFLAPEALYGEYDITLGTTTTKIDPKQHRVMISENQSSDNLSAENNNIALLIANYRAVLGPVEIVAARPATTVSLVNRYTGERMMRLWIDNQTKIVLAKEAYHQDGSLAWRSRFDEIRFTGQIPSDVFSTSIPNDFQQVEGRRFADINDDLQRTLDDAGFKPENPRYLPDGFHMIGAENSSFRGLRNLHLLYSDGIRTLSLFENNADSEPDFGGMKPSVTHFEGHDAQYVTDGPTTLLTWREKGLAFALIGDLDLKSLTEIAISVVP